MGYEWDSKGCFWVSECVSLKWDGRNNAKTKSLMGKRVVYGWLRSIYELRICTQKKQKKKTNKQTNKVGKECLRLSGCGLRGVIYELGRAKLHAEIWQSNKSNKIFKGVGVCVCLWDWCDYPFIVELRGWLAKIKKRRADQEEKRQIVHPTIWL